MRALGFYCRYLERGDDVSCVCGPGADGKMAFCIFLKTEFCEENIEFWNACEDLRMLSSHQELTSKANSIYEEFIKNEAPKEVTGLHRVPFSRAAGELRKTDGVNSNFSCLLQVNLDFYTKNKIIQNLKEPNMAIFLAAQQKVYSLMENNSYPRFIHSELYNELLAAARRRKRSKGFKVDSKTR